MGQLSGIWLAKFNVEIVEKIIEEFNLHQSDNYPISARPLYDALNIRICTEIKLPAGQNAFTYKNQYYDYGVAVFGNHLSPPLLNHAIFHELGHLLFHENGRRHSCVSKGGVVRKEEVEADLFACYLAAPGWKVKELFKQGFDFSQVCQLLILTPRLLELRIALMEAKTHLSCS